MTRRLHPRCGASSPPPSAPSCLSLRPPPRPPSLPHALAAGLCPRHQRSPSGIPAVKKAGVSVAFRFLSNPVMGMHASSSPYHNENASQTREGHKELTKRINNQVLVSSFLTKPNCTMISHETVPEPPPSPPPNIGRFCRPNTGGCNPISYSRGGRQGQEEGGGRGGAPWAEGRERKQGGMRD
ncbi:uncharacterized protein VTP21DRAFT_3785 [Calcarisporiella thermophila]|uniref:uncharacterized protein n=1 Tax=Calcarisporiella thermophila TaxID=911321 RepID=UPI00374270B8